MSEPEAPQETLPPPPEDLPDLRSAVQVMIGQQIFKTLQSKAPSAAQLHAAMKWIDQTATAPGATAKGPMELAIEAAARSMKNAGTAPDLAIGPDEA